MELPDVMSMMAPNPLLVQQCIQDTLFNMDGMQKAEKVINQVYSSIGAEKKFKCNFYDLEHQFNIQMQEDAFAWLEQWMK
jgi:hypothetical protein